MRSLLVTFVAVLAMVLLSSTAQADQVSVELQDVTLTGPCSDCEIAVNTETPVLPQGETGDIQPIGDHGWGGETDDPDYNWWTSLWVLIMDILYFYHLDVI